MAVALALCILGVAGLLKFYDLSVFNRSLSAWSVLPRWSHAPISLLIPAAELALAMAWFCNVRRRLVCLVAGILYCAFAVLHSVQLRAGLHPQCACAGVLSEAIQVIAQAVPMAIGTALAGMVCMAVGAWWPVGAGVRTAPAARGVLRARARGLTLVETLMVIAAVSVLVASSLPSLRGAREAARQARSLADLRSLGAGMLMYAGAYREAWPCITVPTASHTVIRVENFTDTVPYFAAKYRWHLPLAREWFGVPWWSTLFASPFYPIGGSVATYYYSATFIAAPEYWQADTRTGPMQWGATHTADVLFPSKKVILALIYDFLPGRAVYHDPAPLALTDGSATAVRIGQIARGYPRGEGTWPGCEDTYARPGIHTIGGVRGRDLP